jgi:hypothetical protein
VTEQYTPGDRVSMLVARRDELMRFELTLAPAVTQSWRLEVDPTAPPAAARTREEWLRPGGPA